MTADVKSRQQALDMYCIISLYIYFICHEVKFDYSVFGMSSTGQRLCIWVLQYLN